MLASGTRIQGLAPASHMTRAMAQPQTVAIAPSCSMRRGIIAAWYQPACC